MSFFSKLFNKKEAEPWHLTLNLNARLMPMDRGELEDAIDVFLEENAMGEVDGGGTLQSPTGEIDNCDIEICLHEKSDTNYKKLQEFLSRLGVPKGSFLISEGSSQAIGELEGLALYLNGTDLDDAVYAACDINHVVAELLKSLGNEQSYYSHWQGASETALYFYGPSFDSMKQAILPFAEEYPLCQKCRIVQIV